MEPSSQAVMVFTCCRGLAVEVPVAGSYPERVSGITCVPVLFGSNDGSPAGTGMLNAPVPDFERLRAQAGGAGLAGRAGGGQVLPHGADERADRVHLPSPSDDVM